MSDRTTGLYQKFNVTRTDGSSEPGGKHEHCRYIVLDVTHDPSAHEGIKAYAWAVLREGYFDLAIDLFELIGLPYQARDAKRTKANAAENERRK